MGTRLLRGCQGAGAGGLLSFLVLLSTATGVRATPWQPVPGAWEGGSSRISSDAVGQIQTRQESLGLHLSSLL